MYALLFSVVNVMPLRALCGYKFALKISLITVLIFSSMIRKSSRIHTQKQMHLS